MEFVIEEELFSKRAKTKDYFHIIYRTFMKSDFVYMNYFMYLYLYQFNLQGINTEVRKRNKVNK